MTMNKQHQRIMDKDARCPTCEAHYESIAMGDIVQPLPPNERERILGEWNCPDCLMDDTNCWICGTWDGKTCDCLEFRDALGYKWGKDEELAILYRSFKLFCERSDEPELRSEHLEDWKASRR